MTRATDGLPLHEIGDQLHRIVDELAEKFHGVFGRDTVPQVLFIRVHNAGRSQMAAALLEHHAFGKVAVRSAGSRPRGDIPATITDVLGELGVPLTHAFPKPLTDEVVRAADVVVTMGCGDACPVYPGKRYLDWDVADPAGASPSEVRHIRNDIDRRIRALVSELVGD